MATTLKTKNSVTTTVTPTTLAQGELAVNITDKKMWVGNAATTPVQILGAGATNRAGGSNTQVQYNSSGDLAGSANMTFNGTNLSLANPLTIQNATLGYGGGSINTNFGVGYGTLLNNTSGSANGAFGYGSLQANTTGAGNVAIGGYNALTANTTGGTNTAVGSQALTSNTTASGQTAVGYQAGYSTTTGRFNSFFGAASGFGNTTGQYNAVFGGQDGAGYATYAHNSGATGNYNSVFGNGAMALVTTGSSNAAVGLDALFSTTTGSYNVAVGMQSLQANTTASNNTAVGYQAGYSCVTSAANTYVGSYAGLNSTGGGNTIVGNNAGSAASFSGTGNVLVGVGAGVAMTTGASNTFVGGGIYGVSNGAGAAVTTGSKNSILGNYSGNQGGLDIRTASNYIVLSDGDGNPRLLSDGSGNIAIGATSTNGKLLVVGSAGSAGSTPICYFGDGTGGTSLAQLLGVDTANGWTYSSNIKQGVGPIEHRFYSYTTFAGRYTTAGVWYQGNNSASWSTTSDERVKENIVNVEQGLSIINALRPVEFDYKVSKAHDIGFIAQEYQKILPDQVHENTPTDGNEEYVTDGKMLGITPNLVPFLVKAIQELNAKVTALEAQLQGK